VTSHGVLLSRLPRRNKVTTEQGGGHEREGAVADVRGRRALRPLTIPEFGNVVAPNTTSDAAALSFAQFLIGNLTPNVYAES